MISLMERKVIVKCLEKDVELVKSVGEESVALFKELMKLECDQEWDVDLIVHETSFLNERRLGGNESFKLEKG
jgi:hypothetical protein